MGFCDFPLADTLCAVGDAATFASDPGKAIGDWIAKSAGELAAATADLAATAVNATTTPDLNAGWFRDNYAMLLPIGLIVLVATFCAQLVRAAVKRDGQALAQAVTGTISGVLFAFCAIALTTVAIEVVDALSDGLFKAADLSIETAVRRIVKVSQLGALSGLGWMIPSITALGAAIGALLYWCVMMVRKVGILVMVTLAVFAGAGGGWEAARRWRRGWIEATATLVVSKLLMTVIFVLGIAAMGNTDSKDGMAAFADVMSGIVIMLLVLLSPYATFKFVHWAAEGTDGESIHRSGGAGAQLAKQHAEKAARKAASLATTAATGGAAAGAEAGAAQGPDPSSSGGGFPGDIAANPTSGSDQSDSQSGGIGLSPGGDALKSGLEKAVQPPPTSPADEASSQLGGGSGAGATPRWPDAAPTTAPPPQGAPPSPGSQSAGNTGTAAPPPAGP
ncbi:SCO6881 family protein [Streptomyces niveus]|uniref:SCO6881 family protein n=1 Tax=Streptomyces niveus TaxID=193462 RepID=UPI0036C197EF